jgi:hypothetical protein
MAMRHYVIGVLLGIGLALPVAAHAQSAAWSDRGYADIDAWYQPVSTTFTDTIHPIIQAEAADIGTSYEVQSAFGFDAGGGVRVWRNLALGGSFSRFAKSGTGTVDARVPHPFFFGRPRTVTGDADGLTRNESAVHVKATWMLPLRPRWQVALSGGPSWINVSQDLVTTVALTETYPYDTATLAGATSAQHSAGHIGFNVGADVAYLLRPHVGVGAGVSLSHARVPLNDTITVDAGGAHITGGLRLRF